MLDNQQIKVCLTEDKEVLSIMRKNGSLKKVPGKDGEIFEIMFDGTPIEFKLLRGGERTIYPMSSHMATCLIHDAHVLVGAALDGEFRKGLVNVGQYKLTEGDPNLRQSKTTCPYCLQECHGARELAAHLTHQCEHPDAAVPKFLKEQLERKKAKEDAERAKKDGPTPERIQEVLVDSIHGKREPIESADDPAAATSDEDNLNELDESTQGAGEPTENLA